VRVSVAAVRMRRVRDGAGGIEAADIVGHGSKIRCASARSSNAGGQESTAATVLRWGARPLFSMLDTLPPVQDAVVHRPPTVRDILQQQRQ
jgi:hypothetical protein